MVGGILLHLGLSWGALALLAGTLLSVLDARPLLASLVLLGAVLGFGSAHLQAREPDRMAPLGRRPRDAARALGRAVSDAGRPGGAGGPRAQAQTGTGRTGGFWSPDSPGRTAHARRFRPSGVAALAGRAAGAHPENGAGAGRGQAARSGTGAARLVSPGPERGAAFPTRRADDGGGTGRTRRHRARELRRGLFGARRFRPRRAGAPDGAERAERGAADRHAHLAARRSGGAARMEVRPARRAASGVSAAPGRCDPQHHPRGADGRGGASGADGGAGPTRPAGGGRAGGGRLPAAVSAVAAGHRVPAFLSGGAGPAALGPAGRAAPGALAACAAGALGHRPGRTRHAARHRPHLRGTAAGGVAGQPARRAPHGRAGAAGVCRGAAGSGGGW